MAWPPAGVFYWQLSHEDRIKNFKYAVSVGGLVISVAGVRGWWTGCPPSDVLVLWGLCGVCLLA